MVTINDNSVVIPTNTIRQILKNTTNYDVSKQAILYCKKLAEEYLGDTINKAVKHMEKTNLIRERANLPIQKRLSVSDFKSLSENCYNLPDDFLHDERGLTNRDTRLSNANMEVV